MKYPIKKEFGIYRRFRAPVNAVTIRAAKVLLSVCHKGMRSSKSLTVEKKSIVSFDGKKFRLYVIIPVTRREDAPVVLYLHGGGFVFKGAPYHYKLAREYALRTQSVTVFADYRLAFEKPRGATLSDCLYAYKYILSRAEEFCAHGVKICLAGDSAGGYLCLALANLCKEKGLPMPQKLMLAYPAVDPLMRSASMRVFTDTPMWNSVSNRKMWKIYTGGGEAFCPLDGDLSGFPETYIETAEFDCLRDEGVELFEKLEKSGVSCVLNQTRGTMHGFDIRMKAPTAREAVKERIKFLNS